MAAGEIDAGLVASLRKIERAVLAEVPLRPGSVLIVSAAIVVLVCASIGTWVASVADHDCPLAGVAVGIGCAAAAVSTVAVLRRRFAVCWVAAAVSAIGFPLTIFGYWALQTANDGETCLWLLLAAVAHAALLGQWVRCALPAAPRAASDPHDQVRPLRR